jgi:hypothetical protein
MSSMATTQVNHGYTSYSPTNKPSHSANRTDNNNGTMNGTQSQTATASPFTHYSDTYVPSENSTSLAKQTEQVNPDDQVQNGPKRDGIPTMAQMQARIKEQILAQVYDQKNPNDLESASALESILYEVAQDTEVAEVPEFWNAENTSQRIFDFAMSFRELYPEMSDEEYVSQVQEAVEKGFGEAKSILGDALPEPSKKLYNDTYEATMNLFKNYLEQKNTVEDTENSEVDSPVSTEQAIAQSNKEAAQPQLNMVA